MIDGQMINRDAVEFESTWYDTCKMCKRHTFIIVHLCFAMFCQYLIFLEISLLHFHIWKAFLLAWLEEHVIFRQPCAHPPGAENASPLRLRPVRSRLRRRRRCCLAEGKDFSGEEMRSFHVND